jgi:mannosyltransferase
LPVGVTAGLALAASPLASRYGQEARPYALAALAATVAALALVHSCDGASQTGAAPRKAWVVYALAVVATGLVNALALLMLAGHAVFVVASRRWALRRWAGWTTGAAVVLGPFLVATSRQSGQVGWLTRPTSHDLAVVLQAPFGAMPGAIVVCVVMAVGVLGTRQPAFALGAAWGLLPPVLLWLISQWHPLFDGRYAVAALPGTCLALAAAALPRDPFTSRNQGKLHGSARAAIAAGALVVVLALVGGQAQLAYRDRISGHAEDVRGALAILTRHAEPGDAVLFVPYHLRIVTLMAPGLGRPSVPLPDDVALGRDALASATLTGEDVAPADLQARLADRDRVWLVTGPTGTSAAAAPADVRKVELLRRDYVEVRRSQVPHFTVALFERRPSP